MPKPTLVLVYEPESACRARLAADGFAERHALEISSYLAQSTDLAPEFPVIERACATRGIDFLPLELDDAAAVLAGRPAGSTLVWTLTDGIAYFRGGAAPALARLNGLPTIGADDSLFALCQDKFRSGAVLSALGLPVPPAGLALGGKWLAEPPASTRGWFVKPNRLGAKIGIWPDSHCDAPDKALELSRRVFDAYRDAVVVQPYVPGRNVRASFLAVRRRTPVRKRSAFSSSIRAAISRRWTIRWRFTAIQARPRSLRAAMPNRRSSPSPTASRMPPQKSAPLRRG